MSKSLKKICLFTGIFACIAGISLGMAAAEIRKSKMKKTKLIKNGDFKSGLKNWIRQGWGPKKSGLIKSSRENGKKILKINSNGVSWHFVGQTVKLENNKTYRLKLKGKTDGQVGGVIEIRGIKIGKKSAWGPENRLMLKQYSFVMPKWKTYTLEFTVPDKKRAQNKVCISFGTSSWKNSDTFVLYDDIVLEEVASDLEGKATSNPISKASSNMVLNGGFEFGLSDWIPARNCSFIERGVRLDSSNPYKGKFCLEADNKDIRYPFDNTPAASGGHLLSNWVFAEPGHTYYLSLAMKGSFEGQKAWFCISDGKIMDPVWKSPRKHIRLTKKWQLFKLKQFIPDEIPLRKLLVEVNVGRGRKFWLDAVSLTRDKPADDSTCAYDNVGVSVKLGRFPAVYNYGEKAEIILEAVNSSSKSQNITIKYELKDIFDKLCAQGDFKAELAAGKLKQKKLKIDTFHRGRFELYTRVLDNKGRLLREKKTSFVVMKAVAVNPYSPIGINCNSTWRRGRTISDNMKLLGTYGYSWVRLWFAWKFAEPFDNGSKAKFDWQEFDRLVTTVLKNKLNILGMVTVSWEPPVSFRNKFFYGNDYHHKKSKIRKNRSFDRWCRFVKGTVERYKDKIDLWEMQNEPDMYPPENLAWYNALVKATYPVIKKADTQSRAIACSPGDNGFRDTWNSHLYVENFLKNGGVKYCDAIGLHPYTGTGSPIWADLQGTLDQIQGWIKQSGGKQHIIMTEAGNYNSVGGYNLDNNDLSQASRQTQSWLIAWANKTQHFQHASTPDLNSRRTCYDPVFIPNATFCAANALAELFNGSKYDSCKWIKIPKKITGIYGLQFTNGGDLIMALWCVGEEKRLLALPVSAKKMSAIDLMGNSIKLKARTGRTLIPISSNLVYTRIYGAALKNAVDYLKQANEIEIDSASQLATRIGAVQPGEVHAVGYTPPVAGPFKVDAKGFVKDWLIIGPFANLGARGQSAGFNFDFLKTIGGEAAIRLRPEMSVFYEFPRNYNIPRREVKATASHSLSEHINLKKIMYPGEYVVSYAYMQLSVPKTIKAELCVGSDDGIKVWFNGKKVINNRAYRGAAPDQDCTDIVLKKGINRIMVKVDTDVGGWGFYFRFLDEKGKPITNLEIGW